ncbi:Ribosomal L28e/Mak16 [Trinorchestia longiramus]|nr:Ribosomal L28e/Mak16 [Trinorchestia longiramus]
MQNDDVTWSIINKHHCSYKIKTESQWFCRNQYNVTGLCNRKSCPLANSRYATIREKKGVLYLFIREPERVYTPYKEWMRIKLSKTFITALQQIEDNLVFWPNYYKQKCRQRLLKITQYLARMRKMKLNNTKKLVPVRRKVERRLEKREEKALIAAKLDNAIEKQLLERLKEGTYERIYNFPKHAFDVRLNEEELEEELEEDVEELKKQQRLAVKEEEGEVEEVQDEELREELERGIMRMQENQESDEDSDEAQYDYSDDENISDEGELASAEDDDDEEDEEEEEEETGHVEYVADFEESDDEEPERDIEDLPESMAPPARKAKPGSSSQLARKLDTLLRNDMDSDDDMRAQDEIKRAKYAPQKALNPGAKATFRKKLIKRKIRAIYEKQKAEKEKVKSQKDGLSTKHFQSHLHQQLSSPKQLKANNRAEEAETSFPVCGQDGAQTTHVLTSARALTRHALPLYTSRCSADKISVRQCSTSRRTWQRTKNKELTSYSNV